MITADLILTQKVFEKILSHLLRDNPAAEEAAFCFVQRNESGELTLLDWYPVPIHDFDYYSLYHFELSDECQARIIKKAYDLRAKIVEFHSHPYPHPAEFSSSDKAGFKEFVPHVWWRLKGEPYAAVVVAPGSFDSLIWTARPDVPDGVLRIRIGTKVLEPTTRTYRDPMEVKLSC
jgi:proteasome lid subunit RPN8/RPN11